MEITLSKYAGFCDGVERAYDIVNKIANDPKVKKPIYVLGSLVHNGDVVKRIESLGVKKIDLEGFKEMGSDKIKTLVITAHGMGPKIYEMAKEKGVGIVDTTCPRVIKVQRIAKAFLERGSQIVIVGERDHKEVKGIYEWAMKKAQFVEKKEDLEKLDLDPNKKVLVISQTTQNQDFVKTAAEFIGEKYPDVEIMDTICLATHSRQNEVKKMAEENDAIIVIGSPESANSNRLWEISEKINPASYFIERAEKINKKWLEKCEKVGVTAGASTPKWIIKEVLEYLEKVKE